jgi:tryptophan synthase beta chain
VLPALETAHGVAYAIRLAAEMDPDQIVIINCSGRGDKDVQELAAWEKRQQEAGRE